MAFCRIVHCAPRTDDNDVITLRVLSAHLRKSLFLEINKRQIRILADSTKPSDAKTLQKARSLTILLIYVFRDLTNPGDAVSPRKIRATLVLKKKHGIVGFKRSGTMKFLK